VTTSAWVTAFATQAKADFDAWDKLKDLPLSPCQALHFLQMACEKLTKAVLCEAGSDLLDLQSSHAYTAKNLHRILSGQLKDWNTSRNSLRALEGFMKRLAREIELLSPAVDDGGKRPDNCEYPWEDGMGNVWIPAEYQFSATQLLSQPQGGKVLELIRMAIRHML
jgi:hypothetical protein